MRHEGFGGRTGDLCEGPARETDVVSGCVMLIRRSVFDGIGLFDERYFYSFEDIEFCLRARRAGHRILLVPQALAYHEGHQSIGAASASRLYYAARNHLLLAQSALPLTGLARLRPCRRHRDAECRLRASRARRAEAGGAARGALRHHRSPAWPIRATAITLRRKCSTPDDSASKWRGDVR